MPHITSVRRLFKLLAAGLVESIRCTEQHLEKTAVAYIQWRFQAGHDKEILEKVTRVLTDEDKQMMEKEWVGKTGEKRKVEVGRRYKHTHNSGS